MSENIVFSLKGVSKSYGIDGEKNEVLHSVDFSVAEGTIMGLVGRNGAGKSTLIKCLLGLLKPDAGDITVFGEPAWNLSSAVKHRIGYVPQTVRGFHWMRIGNMLAYTGSFYDHWNSEKIAQLLKEWELDPFAKIDTLSEGEMQKLAIIQAMGHEPDLYILDEPVASLDPVARRKFIKYLIDLNISEGKTVLFSTHITSDLERVAADIALLKDGKIDFTGDLAVLKDRMLRLRITSDKPLPETLPVPNAVSSTVKDTHAVVTVDWEADVERQIHTLEKELSATVTVEHLNLEDIFLELNK
ncbi:MAG: ABC transporter ATP-binding protein [bacterium]|nr:ABC transporter ATP-binding protein [bacterium]